MKRYMTLFVVLGLAFLLAACGDDEEEAIEDLLLDLEVVFTVPETAEVGEEVELKATVTYGDEEVTDASQMDFEVWERGDKENSETIEAENHEDGTYTINYTFDDDGIYEMYAHTTAHQLHTMPLKEITIGEGGEYEDTEDAEDGFHTEGFDMHFMDIEAPLCGEEQDLVVHIMLDEEAYEDLDVRYEIVNNGEHDWIDATEDPAGEYVATYSFEEVGQYEVVIHVEDDEDLHAHSTVEVEVAE